MATLQELQDLPLWPFHVPHLIRLLPFPVVFEPYLLSVLLLLPYARQSSRRPVWPYPSPTLLSVLLDLLLVLL